MWRCPTGTGQRDGSCNERTLNESIHCNVSDLWEPIFWLHKTRRDVLEPMCLANVASKNPLESCSGPCSSEPQHVI